MKVAEYLNSKSFSFKEVKRSGGTNAIMVCPFCNGGEKHEKTFAINLDTGAWNCLRSNKCGLSGSFYNLQRQLGDKPEFVNTGIKAKTYVKPRPEILPVGHVNAEYLKQRKLTGETIKKFKLFSGKSGEICFPFYKKNKVVNVKYRTRDKKFRQEKDAEPCLFNRDNVSGKVIIITEGELDCMALNQYGYQNVASLPSGASDHRWIENEWEYLEPFDLIYLCMDDDPAGWKATALLVNRLGSWRCKSVTFPHKDALACLEKNISKKAMDKCFDNAKEYPPTSLNSATDYHEEVLDLFLNPEKSNGVNTGFDKLNCLLKGWREGELTIWSGQNGSGKTTIINQVCLNLTSLGEKTCIASLELRPARYLKWAVCQATGEQAPSVSKIHDVFSWWYKKMYIFNISEEIEPDKIFNAFQYAAQRYGVKHFVIDSLMRVKLSGDEYVAQKEFVSKLLTFVKQFRVHCHLVAHPRKTASDKDKPDKMDVKGTSEITDLADNVLMIWRNHSKEEEEKSERATVKTKKNDPDTVLYLKKNREEGSLGAIGLFFDKQTRRFSGKNQEINFYIQKEV